MPRYYGDKVPSTLRCNCGGRIVILESNPDNDIAGCQKCGQKGRIQNDQMEPGMVIDLSHLRVVPEEESD